MIGEKGLKTVWYVDDDEEMIGAIRLLLRLLHYETRPFLFARQAIEALQNGERPDVMILDIHMPEIMGTDLLEYIRRNPAWSDLPIVMLSSAYTDSQVNQALALGADAYLFKPVTLDELEEALDTAIQKRPKNTPAGQE